jgi:hypothetical protein
MYNLDQVTHKQIQDRRTFMKVCEWLGPGYTSINSGKNALNPYNSVTKYIFFSFVLKIYLWGFPVRKHTFHWCVSAMNNKMN